MNIDSIPFFLDYERLSHHKSMMSDRVRIEDYRKAIEEVVTPGDVVVDLGAGTGILSFIAAKAGAKVVYAIERTDMVHMAKKIAEDNLIHNIVFIQQDSGAVELPEKCDVLLSECLGYMVIQENMITDFFEFRDRWLKDGGSVIPLDAELFFAPIESERAYESVSFWDEILEYHGFDYKALRGVAVNSASHEQLSFSEFLSVPQKKYFFDFRKDVSAAFLCETSFDIERSGSLFGIGGYFTSRLSNSVVLDSSPNTKTHWRQHFFPLSRPTSVKKGDMINFRVEPVLQKAMVDWTWEIGINGADFSRHDTRRGIRLKEQMK
jgi:SAM-dependent methyltransferase